MCCNESKRTDERKHYIVEGQFAKKGQQADGKSRKAARAHQTHMIEIVRTSVTRVCMGYGEQTERRSAQILHMFRKKEKLG